MVFSSLYSMVGRNSIMAHRDAELKRGGDHLIREGRTKAQGALNARRAARRVSEANHPEKSTSWTPAFAGVTVYSGFP